MPFQSRQFPPRRMTKMPSCPSTGAFKSMCVSQPSNEPDQNHGARGGDRERAYQAGGVYPQQTEDEPADDRTDQAEQEVDEDAVAPAPHDLAGEKACEDPDRDFPDQIHQCLRS